MLGSLCFLSALSSPSAASRVANRILVANKPCQRRATSDTRPPGTRVFATICAFSSLDQRRRRPSRVSSSTRRNSPFASSLTSCVDSPLDAREKVRHLTGGSIAIMCPALSARFHDRWPRWGPRPSPKQTCGFESRDVNRVLWIVGSTDRHLISLFHPGTNTWLRRSPTEAARSPHASS